MKSLFAFVLMLASCAGSSSPSDATTDASNPRTESGFDGARDTPDAPITLPDVSFMHPDYTPHPGTCGFDSPAFCETFESGPVAGGRSGEIDPARWSVGRGTTDPYPTVFGAAFAIPPSRVPECRAGVTGTLSLPDQDVLVCDPTATIQSRHLLSANAAQNYGVQAMRIRQPFDFASRTGTIKLDVDLTGDGLCGWPAMLISEDPLPAPSFDRWEHASGLRNGIEIDFDGNNCHVPTTASPSLHSFRDYVETVTVPTDNDPTTCANVVINSLNHVEISLTQTHLEIWVSDPSPDGETFTNLRRIWATDIALPFNRGYVSISNHNHATLKYWCGTRRSHAQGPNASGSFIRWDNIGFDGPVVTGWNESSAADSLTSFRGGLAGCMNGSVCEWRTDTIEHNPDESVCPPAMVCRFDGESRNVGYVLGAEPMDPVRLEFADVHVAGATRARLTLGAWYLQSTTSTPPSAGIRYRINGGTPHDRMIDTVESNAFLPPEGAGNLNQVIDVPLSELHDGMNVFELYSLGPNTGYPVGIANADLVLTATQ